MTTTTTRRRFIEIVPMAGVALLAACSPKNEPTPAADTNVAPPAPAPTPTPTPTPTAAPEPTAAPASAATADLPRVDEKDAQAMVLGYVSDATRADKEKFKSYVAGSLCSNCALYLGKADDAAGPCPLFQGKSVAATGWCSSWAKKA